MYRLKRQHEKGEHNRLFILYQSTNPHYMNIIIYDNGIPKSVGVNCAFHCEFEHLCMPWLG